MDAMLERRPFGLRLEHTVWLAAFRDEFLNLMPHTIVAVTLLVLLDQERLIKITQPADGATNGHQATRDRGIRYLPLFLGPLHEQLPKDHLRPVQRKSMDSEAENQGCLPN